jgi:hypothetical protein
MCSFDDQTSQMPGRRMRTKVPYEREVAIDHVEYAVQYVQDEEDVDLDGHVSCNAQKRESTGVLTRSLIAALSLCNASRQRMSKR